MGRVNNSDTICLLDDTLVNQIAAGEVVERPASVVKELVENSIDAGATKISVSILNGGISEIEVLDDGRGMSKDDLQRAIQRFATSKIAEVDDLSSILSYGFRGEALPSIASVSKLTVTSRRRSFADAFQLRVDAGSSHELLSLSAPEGTRIKVKDLFFSVPARRKFLKSERAESGAVRSVITDFALAHPEIGFSLYDDNKEILVYPVGQTLRERVSAAKVIAGLPVELKQEMAGNQPSDVSPGQVKVWGYLSQPLHAVRGGSRLRYFINGRVIKSALLLRATRDGFGSFLKPGTYPTGVVNIGIHPSEVDVNVHPQKTEVRFRYESAIFSAVRSAVIESLADSSKEVRTGKPYVLMSSQPAYSAAKEHSQYMNFTPIGNVAGKEVRFVGNGSFVREDISDEGVSHSISDPVKLVDTDIKSVGKSSDRLKYLGQIFKLYLLFEADKRLMVVDMHAAHERITFFQLKKSFREKKLLRHELLFPISIPVSEFDINYDLDSRLLVLGRFGIEAELRSEEVLVRSIPSIIGQDSVPGLVKDLLNAMPDTGIEAALEKKSDDYLARLACHGSIRRGQELSRDEAYALLDELELAELSGWCPHGRPVVWWLTESELESRFGRIAPTSSSYE